MWVGAVVRPGRCARLVVRDSGCGIERAVMEKMFEPFYTTKPVGSGTGLGLAAVHGIVIAHGGAIAIESKPGAGTAFEILLPLAEDPAAPVAETTTAEQPKGSERILVIDDDDAVLTVIAEALGRCGYRVTCCANAAQALEAIEVRGEGFDLVVTDQTMPGMTGTELAAALHRLRPALPVVLCSGHAPQAASASAAGIAAFVAKPIEPNEFARIVRATLDGATASSGGQTG
jgi:CheY-like chemotaxis protein